MTAPARRSLVGRLALWAAVLVAVSVPLFWVLFTAAVETVSRDVVDTCILEFADQVRGYWASLEADPAEEEADTDPAALGDQEQAPSMDLPAPGLGGADVEWVWQITRAGRVVDRSELLALTDTALAASVTEPSSDFRIADRTTRLGDLRLAERVVDEVPPFPAEDASAPARVRVHYLAGLSAERYQAYVDDHAARLRSLAPIAAVPVSLVLLGMLAFIVLALRRDLGAVGAALNRYEAGTTETVEGRFPAELQDLVDRINALLAQNARLVARTRKYVSKIAHDINHPLAIMKNALAGEDSEAEGSDGGGRVPTNRLANKQLLSRQVERMTGLVDRYASLARAIGPEGKAGRQTRVAELLADVAEGFSILYRRTPLAIDSDCDDALMVPIPRHDLEAMVSNLVSNAHKFAESHVRLAARVEGGADGSALVLTVEDDGPGVPADKRATVLDWGERLDEAPPGTGFGLSIVRDIADLYQGTVSLSDSAALGGLKAEIRIPLDAAAGGGGASDEGAKGSSGGAGSGR